MRNKALSLLLGSLILLLPFLGNARDRIWAVGSSTVYPFVTMSAELFGQKTDYKTPVVESLGTGGGIKLFCGGDSADTPDLANASRAIKESEIELCAKNGVHNIIEIKFGLDGLVLANSVKSKPYVLSKQQIFLALARQIPVKGKLVENPNQKWSDIDKKLPEVKIEVYGPPPTSGTRDAFVEMVMHKACDSFPEFAKAYPDKKAHEKACGVLREDGAFVEAGENDNLIIQKLVANPDALGIFGFSFLEENADKVQGSAIGGVKPTFENVSTGAYPVTRPLFVYMKGEHVGKVPGLKEFAEELARDSASGMEGYLTEKGLIPLPGADREQLKKKVQSIQE